MTSRWEAEVVNGQRVSCIVNVADRQADNFGIESAYLLLQFLDRRVSEAQVCDR